MNVLFLGYADCKLLEFLHSKCKVFQTTDRLSLSDIDEFSPDIIISYGYRYIIKKDIIDKYEGKIINLHISYLPWNRGVGPNLWSIVEDTEKGVTIHILDEGIDTGDILFQKKVEILDEDTLATSYNKLRDEIEILFKQSWSKIKSFNFERIKQNLDDGSYHSKKQTNELLEKLDISGRWDITIKELAKNDME